ncbi:MAG: ABC transporter substrate-binding protein [Betaproteobacteria bacterium]
MSTPLPIRALRTVALTVVLAAQGLPVAHAADKDRTLHVAQTIAETSFDPAFASDAASDDVIACIHEAMLDYDYLVRPVKLVARTLEALPLVEEGGKVYTMKVKKGIFFTPDPAFKGKPRELTAADHAYGLKRILDPKVQSPWLWMLEGKIVGADDVRDKAIKSGKFDYDAPMAGITIVDRYTLKIRLNVADLRFLYVLAVPNTAAMAREVVEAYGADIGAHPVGTGPFMLGQYKRSSRIELVANPGYREVTYAPTGPIPPTSEAAAAALKGKRLPRLARIDINIIEEGQGRWLAFLNREVDYLAILPVNLIDQALINGRLKPDLAAKGIVHQVLVRPSVVFTYFNMEDPVVGGYEPARIALRRAIGMAYNNDEAIRVLYAGRALPANGPIPPDIAGYNPKLKTNAQIFDPAASRALLDKFGYKDRDGDGFRETPEGKPLTIERWSPPTSVARERDELWKKNLDVIGIRVTFKYDKLPELRKMGRQGRLPVRDDGWNADYPDAENFMQLLYGPSVGQANYSRFNLPEFNKLFDDARRLPDSPERTRLFDRMTELVVAYSPWRVRVNDIEDTLAHAWVRSYVPHPMRSVGWMYMDVDEEMRARVR